MKTPLASAILAAALASGCATSGVDYQAADRAGETGYTETRLGDDKYRVTYTDKGDPTPDRVKDFALLRAAELTLLDGNDWFRVLSRDSTTREESDTVTTGVAVTGTNTQRRCGLIACTTTATPAYGTIEVTPGRTEDIMSSSVEFVAGTGDLQNPGSVYDASELRTFIEDKYDL